MYKPTLHEELSTTNETIEITPNSINYLPRQLYFYKVAPNY
jgi:hypothetical protein